MKTIRGLLGRLSLPTWLILVVVMAVPTAAAVQVFNGSVTVPAAGVLTLQQVGASTALCNSGSQIVIACAGGLVTSVTGTSPIASSGGLTPAISCVSCVTGVTAGNSTIVIGGTATAPTVAVTAAPSFTGLTISAITGSTQCLQVSTSGVVSGFGSGCGGGGGGVTSLAATGPVTTTGSTGAITIGCATCTTTASTLPFYITSYVSGTLTVTAGPWMPIPFGDNNVTAVAFQSSCGTAGSSGTNTVQWQYSTATLQTTPTSITGATGSFTTAVAIAGTSFTGVNLSGLSALWVRPNITAVGIGPPSNCSFYLHLTHTL